MATITEHVFAVKNLLSKGPTSDDYQFTSSLIEHFLKINRAVLIKRKLDKKSKVSDLNYQTFCISLELVDYDDCDCSPDLHCKILRSTVQLPSFITKRSSNGIVVKLLDGSTLTYMDNSLSKFSKFSLTSQDSLHFFLEGSYLYINGSQTLPKVLVKGIPEDPESLLNIVDCEDIINSTVCDGELHIDAELVSPLYELTIKSLLSTLNIPMDNRNDARTPEALQALEPNER
jgi:hypothetical protein